MNMILIYALYHESIVSNAWQDWFNILHTALCLNDYLQNGNFRNSYNGGWGQFNYNYYPTHQMAAYYPNMRPLPHQVPAHYYGMRHPTYQMPANYPNMRPLPHQVPAHYYGMRHPTYHYVEKRPLPQQTPKASADKKISPDKKPEVFADKRNLPHQKPEDSTDKHCLPQQAPEHVANKRDLPQQKPECYADKKPLPDQTPESFAEKRILSHQNSDGFADKRNLPLQKPEVSTDNKCLPQQTPELPQQTPEGYADKNGLPHQTSKPTIPAVAPVKCQKAAIVSCEICGVSFPQNSLKDHNNGKKHRKNLSKLCKESTNLSKLCKQSKKCKTSKKLRVLLNRTLKRIDQSKSISMDLHVLGGSNTSALTKDTCSGSDPIAIAPPQGLMTSQINSQTKVEGKEHLEVQNGGAKDCADKKSTTRCEICHCTVSRNYIELHNNGRKHQNKVKSMECKISKGEVSGHIRNSQMNPVVHLKKVPKSKKDGHPVENMSQFRCKEVPAEGSKSKLGDHTVAKDHSLMVKKVKNEAPSFKNKKVPAERSKRKVSDTTDAKDHGSKFEIGETSGAKFMKMNSGIRKPVKSSKSEVKSLVQIPEVTPPSGRVASPKMAPTPEEKNDQPHVSASLSQESKGKENHKFQNATVEKNDQPQSTPIELNPSEGSNRTESMSCDFSAIAPPLVPVNCPVFTPSPAVESSLEPSIQTDSQIEVEEGKEHIDVQNCGVKTNDQPQSSTMELHANGGSDINTLIKEDKCSDSGATVIIPSQSPIASQVATPESQRVIHTEKSEGKGHNEIQNHTVDSNDQQQSISMELDDPAGCMTNTQTEVVNSDLAAIEIVIEPLASAPPDAVWSGFEPLTDTEIEPQVSEAVVYYESDDPIEETDIELPPSVPIEIDAGSEVSSETETVDGSPQAEVEMDVLPDELGIIQLPQVFLIF
jgi:hypothetical protein